jgi:hypothetical protein
MTDLATNQYGVPNVLEEFYPDGMIFEGEKMHWNKDTTDEDSISYWWKNNNGSIEWYLYGVGASRRKTVMSARNGDSLSTLETRGYSMQLIWRAGQTTQAMDLIHPLLQSSRFGDKIEVLTKNSATIYPEHPAYLMLEHSPKGTVLDIHPYDPQATKSIWSFLWE